MEKKQKKRDLNNNYCDSCIHQNKSFDNHPCNECCQSYFDRYLKVKDSEWKNDGMEHVC